MRSIEWLDEREFCVDDVKFRCSFDDYSQKTNDERIVLLKDRQVLEQYRNVFAASPPRTVLEFGIFQGGSPALFSLWFGLDKFVGVDICEPIAAFDAFCERHPVGRRIRSHYGVSQTDKERIEAIVRAEFGATPVDAIVDDASHLYEYSRRTFEIAFPYLRPGGVYVIEDWGWAHWPVETSLAGKTPLSKLLMELLMVCASRGDLIEEVRVFSSFAFIRKAANAPALTDMNLASLYIKGGLELVGADDPNLRGVAATLARGVGHRTANKLRQLRRRWRQK